MFFFFEVLEAPTVFGIDAASLDDPRRGRQPRDPHAPFTVRPRAQEVCDERREQSVCLGHASGRCQMGDEAAAMRCGRLPRKRRLPGQRAVLVMSALFLFATVASVA